MSLSKKFSFLIILVVCFEAKSQIKTQYNFENFSDVPKFLSEYGFFLDLQNQIPVRGVHPYSLVSPLFSDESDKLRFVYVPEGKKVGYVKNKVFIFPVGSALIKTFAYLNENGPINKQLLETRLLINTNQGWRAISYVWNKDQTDAKRTIAGATIPTNFINSNGEMIKIRYRAPNQNQCKECHQLSKVMTPIGPKARNMNMIINYKSGEMNQLIYWAALGWINQNLGETNLSNYADVSAALEDRARAYLDINCGHCHISGGSADTTGLYLNYTEQDKEQLGVYKKPVAAGRASGNLKYSIVPGNPDDSILLYRMKSLDPGIMMPESGRALSDEKGIKLITEWIDRL
ncbi:MAG: hypothetical protein CMD68_01800 [Gammaproteobacteria bacterium]|nr:hypothetical protein [Gammaproteobacteria bacterium]|tara:strand:- start:387 stop:1424 length:1038 start_codon:yes stop_codon:yes gene_type:complete